MKIHDHIKKLDKNMIERAQKYLDSSKVKSIVFTRDSLDPDLAKVFPDYDAEHEFEALMSEKGNMLIPGIEVNDEFEVLDIHCQCGSKDELCIHTVAILLAAQIMMETDCADYHTARNMKIGRSLEKLMFPEGDNPLMRPAENDEDEIS